MKKIREVPSRALNEAIDAWIANSIDGGDRTCKYCTEYSQKKCPLNSFNECYFSEQCCDGLYFKYYREKNKKKKRYYANKIVDLIISRCVY
jgi:hypothetical protein